MHGNFNQGSKLGRVLLHYGICNICLWLFCKESVPHRVTPTCAEDLLIFLSLSFGGGAALLTLLRSHEAELCRSCDGAISSVVGGSNGWTRRGKKEGSRF